MSEKSKNIAITIPQTLRNHLQFDFSFCARNSEMIKCTKMAEGNSDLQSLSWDILIMLASITYYVWLDISFNNDLFIEISVWLLITL